ncbi:hypothetical protein DCC62_29700 [candidate division KSB1 bacterium]|nr:MAG: hypothetical protein DCC62_29700 [candidate division KSB1 bacterium]
MKTLLLGLQSQQFQSTVTFVYMSILSFWKNLVKFQAWCRAFHKTLLGGMTLQETLLQIWATEHQAW